MASLNFFQQRLSYYSTTKFAPLVRNAKIQIKNQLRPNEDPCTECVLRKQKIHVTPKIEERERRWGGGVT